MPTSSHPPNLRHSGCRSKSVLLLVVALALVLLLTCLSACRAPGLHLYLRSITTPPTTSRATSAPTHTATIDAAAASPQPAAIPTPTANHHHHHHHNRHRNHPHSPPHSPPPSAPRAFHNHPNHTALTQALAAPVNVALMTSHFLGTHWHGPVANCTYFGHPLNCTIHPPLTYNPTTADVLWYHAPDMCGLEYEVLPRGPHQLSVVASMESDAHYPCLDDPDYMRQFDLEMTYRLCSQAPTHYMQRQFGHLPTLQSPPLPFDQKADAVAYINSNCNALSGRQVIVDAYLALNASIPIHAYGACSNNMHQPPVKDKLAVFHRYKFCICMENSIAVDYVTEKVWHGLLTGCLPIYLGAPNVYDFIPDRDAIINYLELEGGVRELADLLERLAKDKGEYERRLAWKQKPLSELSPGFRALLARTQNAQLSGVCNLCQVAVAHRVQPGPYTTCLFNETWKATAAKAMRSVPKAFQDHVWGWREEKLQWMQARLEQHQRDMEDLEQEQLSDSLEIVPRG